VLDGFYATETDLSIEATWICCQQKTPANLEHYEEEGESRGSEEGKEADVRRRVRETGNEGHFDGRGCKQSYEERKRGEPSYEEKSV
jgi:hypothetical protein